MYICINLELAGFSLLLSFVTLLSNYIYLYFYNIYTHFPRLVARKRRMRIKLIKYSII